MINQNANVNKRGVELKLKMLQIIGQLARGALERASLRKCGSLGSFLISLHEKLHKSTDGE